MKQADRCRNPVVACTVLYKNNMEMFRELHNWTTWIPTFQDEVETLQAGLDPAIFT